MAEISVVIPCYNQARFLDAALDTVWMQNVLPARVYVVNDGSTDDVDSVVMNHPLFKASRLTYFPYGENSGVGHARNKAIARVPEEHWILCLDSDDALFANAIEQLQLAIASSPEANLITFPLEDFSGPHRRIWNPPAEVCLEQLDTRNLLPYCAAYPKALWATIGGYDEGECSRLGINDWEFWQRAHRLVGLKPVRVDAPLVRYRQHAGPRLSDQFKGREALVRSALRRARERSMARNA